MLHLLDNHRLKMQQNEQLTACVCHQTDRFTALSIALISQVSTLKKRKRL